MVYLGNELHELQQSNSTVFDFIQESALSGLWFWDLDDESRKWANAKFWQTMGYDPAAMPDQAEAWGAVIGPEDIGATDQHTAECIENHTYSFDQVVQGTHCNGSMVWLHCWGLVLHNAAGQPHRLLGVLMDITTQRNDEIHAQELANHYGSILRNQSVYIIKTDARGNYTYVNDFFYERFGGDNKLIGTDSMLSIVEEDWPKCLLVVGRCFAEPEVPHQVILRKPYRDQTVKSNHWEFKGMLDSDGQVGEIQCVGYDVTLLVDNLERSRHLLALTNQQNARLQNFAYIISHNIRSHSANLTALVKFLQATTDPAQADMFVKMLKTSTDKLAETIVNLNEIVTSNSPSNQLREPRLLRAEVANTLEALSVLMHEHQVAISLDIPAETTVKVVPAYLDSILLNLISNAVKYRSPTAPLRIALGCYRDANFTVLTVKDNGRGLDLSRNRAKLFGMYKTFHDNEDSRGLGLFITKNQIESMNGKIEVESEVGVGSTFKVYFNEVV